MLAAAGIPKTEAIQTLLREYAPEMARKALQRRIEEAEKAIQIYEQEGRKRPRAHA